MQRRSRVDIIFENRADPHPLVAAYCLHALAEMGDPRLVEATSDVAGRTERIYAVYGCFGWEGTLAEYGQKLRKEYIELLSNVGGN